MKLKTISCNMRYWISVKRRFIFVWNVWIQKFKYLLRMKPSLREEDLHFICARALQFYTLWYLAPKYSKHIVKHFKTSLLNHWIIKMLKNCGLWSLEVKKWFCCGENKRLKEPKFLLKKNFSATVDSRLLFVCHNDFL